MVTNSHDFPAIYEHTGIRLNALGCVMLGVESMPITDALGPELSEQLYVSPDPEKFWIKGAVGEHGGHVTLLYGILKQLWRFGGNEDAYFPDVDAVMAGWEQPKHLVIGEFLAWPDPAGGPSTTIVGTIEKDPALVDAHQRLSLLPHVDTFLDYTPHVTLAYAKREAADAVLAQLEFKLDGVIATTDLDYGHPA